MSYDSVKDSGERQEYETGARRDTREGKGRYDLLMPYATSRDAKHLENGAVKYGDNNWRKGMPCSRFLDSALRHLFKFLEGHRDEDHLAAVRWNVGAVMEQIELIKRGVLPRELYDLQDWTGQRPDAMFQDIGSGFMDAIHKLSEEVL